MKLAKHAYIVTLVLLSLVFAANAQTRNARSEKDPRNTAPTVGTGGPVGGATGLFTVYDGQTLRKGEYTLSFAASNYDRDPGNVDITAAPVSFQVGLTNKLELFFSTEAYRGVKVNSPRNLSGFYLPNSKIAGVSPAAIVLAPQGPGASLYANRAVFRPAGMPFVQFPFFGGNAGTYGLIAPFYSGPQFGFAAGTNAQLGGATGTGATNNFPGIGSVYGSILPGIVLQTTTVTGTTTSASTTVPTVYTTAPSYLPDAPFLNRTWGTSTLNSFTGGFKWRWTGVNKPIGAGMVAAYTWYPDTANDFAGFNMMQRGASAGGSKGDVQVTFFADARLARWANLSANVGYNWTSKAEGTFPTGTYTILDRPDELQSSIGLDFPVNKYFQPIFELRSLKYVGGRTPNAFENSPLDGLAGVRFFFRRWVGLSLAYRYHFNEQDANSFDSEKTYTTSTAVPCIVITQGCTASTVTQSWKGVPPGFYPSNDPHGYIVQLFVGRRNKRQNEVPNLAPSITAVNLSDMEVVRGCAPGLKSASGCDDSQTVRVSTTATDPENDQLAYNYTVSGGRISGSGANVDWDLSGVSPGSYTVTVGIDDGCGLCAKTETRTVTVKDCPDCVKPCDCGTLSVTGPSSQVTAGEPMTFTANTSGYPSVTYNWSVSAGTISSGQGTSTITVDTSGLEGQSVTATVELGGTPAGCDCPTTSSETAGVARPAGPQLIDEYGKLQNDDVKARVDNFYIQLNNDPNASGVIVLFGTPAQQKAQRAQIEKAIAFRKYDKSRVSFVNGSGEGPYAKFWLVPAGATPPETTR